MTNGSEFQVHPTAIIDKGAVIGSEASIWHFSHVCEGAKIGSYSSLGQNCFVASDVVLGSNVKVQNNVSIYGGTTIEDDVFLGPSCVLTNVSNPRSEVNRRGLYETTRICRGATIGANATIVCGVTLGRYCFVAAGAVVTKSVPDYAFIKGVPGRQHGWMSRHGHILRKNEDSETMICPESGLKYQIHESGVLRCLEIEEDLPLPRDQKTGHKQYRDYK